MKKTLITFILVIVLAENVFSNSKSFNVNDIYHITNPVTNCEIITTGSGKILSKNSEMSSNLSLLEDVKTGEANYYYKLEVSNKFIDKEFVGDDNKKFKMKEGNRHSIFFDKNGNEVGLDLQNVYGSNFVLNDYITYNIYDEETNKTTFYIYNVKDKTTKKYNECYIEYFSNHPVLSSSSWDDTEKNKRIIVFDDNFNEVKIIDGYSINDMMKSDKINMIHIGKVKNESTKNIDNFLDTNFNKVFENDVEVLNLNSESNIITIKDNDVYYDYDLNTRKKVGDDKPYSLYKNKDQYVDLCNIYAATISNIQKMDKNITGVFPRLYKNKLIYQVDMEPNFEKNIFSTRIYDESLTKMKEFNNIDMIDENNGYIFANFGEVYDFDLNFKSKIGENVIPEVYTCNNKTFYTDMYSKGYEIREKFNLYDSNFNVVLENIKYCDFYTFDKMIQVEDEYGTKIYDSNMNLIKDFDRHIRVYKYYGVDYYSFTDNTTNRMGIIDKNYDVVLEKLKSVSDLKEGFFTYQNGFKYGLMDYTGKVLISFSIFDSMKEDSNPDDYGKKIIDGYIM